MSDRSKRIIDLINNASARSVPPKKRRCEVNRYISTHSDRGSSPIPEEFQEELVQLKDLLGDDVFDDNITDSRPVEQSINNNSDKSSALTISHDYDAATTKHDSVENPKDARPAQSPVKTLEESLLIDHTDTPSTPIPSPDHSHEEPCGESFCSVCVEKIVTNDELYGIDLPTPTSVTATSTNGTPTSIKISRKKTYKQDRGKKRLRHKENWVVTLRKKMKNEGKAFVNQKGKHVAEKSLGQPCGPKCRFKCTENLPTDQRQTIFDKFWSLGNRQKQWEYVVKYTKKMHKRRQTTETVKHDRQNTFVYYLPTASKNQTRVCKTMFLSTISSGERIVTTAWKKYDGDTAVEVDKRGQYDHKRPVLNDDMLRSVRDHVNSLDRSESHYTRKDSKKLYLNNIKSTSRMYNLYAEWFDPKAYTTKANKRQYRDIVNSEFNLAFHKPKKDLCDVCHVFRNNQFPIEEEKNAFEKHQAHKKIARQLKQTDKLEASNNPCIVSATFDFQKVLQSPHGEVSIFYYKRKLNSLNFTVYNLASKDAICYMWHEGTAKRGANEVSSCLYDFIKHNVQNGVNEFRFWSDNCAGQNRNRIVFALYLLASKEFKVTIMHRFMEKGHTQNEGDSVHSAIERASDRKLIYAPEEWYCLVRWAKSEGKPYTVKEMASEDFYDFKNLLTNKNWTKNTVSEKMQWTQIREIRVQANVYDRIEYKYDLEESPKTIIILRSGKRNAQRIDKEFEISRAYDGPLRIPFDKYRDLNQMCASGVIPEKYKSFYKNLLHTNLTVDSDHSDDTD